MVQGELFREEHQAYHVGHFDARAKKSFLSRYQITVSLDQLLLVLIGVTVVFSLTYSFGVERGKRAMEKRLESLIPLHSEVIPAQTETTEILPNPPKEEAVLLVNQKDEKGVPAVKSIEAPKNPLPAVDARKQGNYTIQLVTYMSEDLAAREIDHLKSKGYEGFVIPSGSYFQVCANYFNDRSKAKTSLKQLLELGRYPGAFVRPVIR